MMHRQRGQTLPLTLGGIIAIIVFGFFALNYANTLRWQVRAQTAADSAAQAVLSLQTQQFNTMTATLYASAVEEYRLRHILNGMVLASHHQAGCLYGNYGQLNSSRGCDRIERELEAYYDQSVKRYTGDILNLHQVTVSMNFANFKSDALSLLAQIKACNTSLGGDCAFGYGTPVIQPRTDTEAVFMDANGVLKPSPDNQTALASSVGSPPLNTDLFAPAEVEVYACATVPSLIPSFMGWNFPPFKAVARGAATAVMVEEDWLQPGTITNLFTPGIAYQPPENYLRGSTITDPTGYDWYNLNYGGNGVVAVSGKHFVNTILHDEFSVYVGWWNSIPIHPFGGAKDLSAMGCAA
jgi:hypothetical protein